MSRKLNVERMRKRVNVPRPEARTEDEQPEPTVIKDAAGRVIRVIPPNRRQQ